MSNAEPEEEEIKVTLSGEFLADMRRLALYNGFESVTQLARQVLWRHCYGLMPPGRRAATVTEEIAADRVRPERQPIPPKLRFAVLQRDGHRCVSCGATPAETSLHVDHKTPVARGGQTTMENLQTLCESCNLSKAAKIIEFPALAAPK